MSTDRRLILVTGAPRTATTPIGNMLSLGRRTVALYEPVGPTGLRRFRNWYPMVGEGLDIDQQGLQALLWDLTSFRIEGLKSQVRVGRKPTLKTAIFGSRTLHSFRLARLQPWVGTVIWKDPHAMMMAPDIAAAGIPTIVTIRSPLAHAASYKRLGWRSRAKEIYPRWSTRYGRCEQCEALFDEIDNPVISSALLWRMCYLALIRSGFRDKVYLVSSDQLIADEQGTYEHLFDVLGLEGKGRVAEALSKRRSDGKAVPASKKTHDWTRSVASVNSYWKQTLDDEEIRRVEALTGDVAEKMLGAAAV